MSFIGGIVGVVIAVGIFLKIQKTSKETFFRLLDHIVTIVPLGIML
jgi:prolipoprotein diacylglyceryltransferase